MKFKTNPFKYVTARVFNATATQFQYPELIPDTPGSVADRPNTGVCFSGGGTRSASATHGQLKALAHLGLLDKIRYISCVSGGSWASTPFTFLPDTWEDTHFFGPVLSPGQISLDHLTDINSNNYLHCVVNARILDDVVEHWFKFAGDETYSRAVGDIFLAHFGLHTLDRFFAYTPDHVKQIIENNPDAGDENLYTARDGRPYLIVGGALLRPGPKDALFEMTPMYSGINALYQGMGSNKQHIGGGFIESFALDSDAPEDYVPGNDTATVRLGKAKHRFTLSDMIGTSGAAPAEVLDTFGINDIGFPEFKYWPVAGDDGQPLKAKEYEFGDGGNIENLGIIPLLKRGVEKLIVFVNSKRPVIPGPVDSAIQKLFTPGSVNHIFNPDGLDELTQELVSRRSAGQSVVHRADYTLVENPHYGLPPGQRVEIMWIHNERYENWEGLLPEEVQQKIGHGDLGNYPHYKTFFENFSPIDLKPIQASLLSHLACAVVLDNREYIQAMVGT